MFIHNRLHMAIAGIVAFAACGSAFGTGPITVDPDGPGGDAAFSTDNLDWGPGNSLGIGALSVPGVPSVITLAAHSDLSAFGGSAGGSAPGLGGSYEWTFSTAFPEAQSAAAVIPDSDGDGITDAQFVSFGFGGGPGPNFLEIYYDDSPDADPLTGAGYDDGKLILSANVVAVSGNFTSYNEAPNFSTTNTGVGITLDANAAALATSSTNPNVDQATDAATGYNLLDNFGPDNLAGQQTVDGTGASVITADVTFADPDFFKDDISALVIDMITNTFNNAPFTQTNPSSAFDTVAGTNGTDTVPFLGTVNGLPGTLVSGINFGAYGFTVGQDVQFETDATSSFNKTVVPTPGVVALFGAGLIGLGVVRRRRLGS